MGEQMLINTRFSVSQKYRYNATDYILFINWSHHFKQHHYTTQHLHEKACHLLFSSQVSLYLSSQSLTA